MKWETDFASEPCVVTIDGDVDVTSLPELAALEAQVASRSSVVFDVAGLHYADTSFLRFLVRLRAHANKSHPGAIRLARAGAKLRRLLEVTGLQRAFPCIDPIPQRI